MAAVLRRNARGALCRRGERKSSSLLSTPCSSTVPAVFRSFHAGVGVASHPKITTHPSLNPREEDERWRGKPLSVESL